VKLSNPLAAHESRNSSEDINVILNLKNEDGAF